jgi:hypothetical protein
MTRKELQLIKKPKTGLMTYRGPKLPNGYCEVSLSMLVKWGSLKTVKDLHNAFRARLCRF